uniref:NADH-ubiquinone oxidoreductase chain 5 n=1 Tax=Nymphon gracile TaxID=136195 RepID=A0MG43_NYMGR|nr:NADH dehydrogenase subunit 5 [Nymphon gracile]ABF93275.1 NADH dehydrogenase subunit 5 [Nymphon gracile]
MFIFMFFSFFLFFNSIITVIMFIYFLKFDISVIFDIDILFMNNVNPTFGILIDVYSLFFLCFSKFYFFHSVFLFSVVYMGGVNYLFCFFFLLSMFVFSMFMLIYSSNLITSLLGWDGLGFVSYLLVVYYPNKSSLSGGVLTLMTNRLGDSFMLLSVSFLMVFNMWEELEGSISMFLLVLAAMTKSAQSPFSAWLPAAMAAPTPVSSMVHSSTLVTAGVYVLCRFFSLLPLFISDFSLFCSILTMFLASVCASYENDSKKIIASSTLSQWGVMMFSMSLGLKFLAFFHLIIHAFFKALMFLSGGSLMHGFSGSQDIRFMGSLGVLNPYVMSCLMFSSMCLGAFPFLASFYSKHLILDSFIFMDYNMFMLLVLYISNSMTLFYSLRLVKFLGSRFFNFNSIVSLSEDFHIFISLLLLLVLAMFSGYFLVIYYFSFPVYIFNIAFEKLIMNIMLPFSIIISYLLLNFVFPFFSLKFNLGNWFFGHMWFISFFSGQFFSYVIFNLSNFYILNLEQGWGEFYGPRGMGLFFLSMGKFMNFNYFKFMEFYHLNFFFWLLFIPLL